MPSKKLLIGLLLFVVVTEAGLYLYKKMQSRPDRRTVGIAIAYSTESPALHGMKEGLELASAGVNATKNFSVRLAVGVHNPLALIDLKDDALILRIGGIDTLVIPQGGNPSAVLAGKVKSVYGHDPLPFTAEAFDAVKLIAAGASRVPVGKPIDAETLRAVFGGLRGYTGESGTMRFDEQGVGHR